MPSKCCVIGCNNSQIPAHPTTSKTKNHVFKIPVKKELRNKWLEAIGRKDFNPGIHSVVCSKHFHESDIIKGKDKAVGKKGDVMYFSTKVKLKDGAVPSINMNTIAEKEHRRVKLKRKELPAPIILKTRKRKQTVKSEPQNSSDDDDIPLQKIKNQIIHSPDKKIIEETDDFQDDSDKTQKKKFKLLLEDYEKLKDRSRCLDQEIKVLEIVNVKLKSDIFKC